MTVLFVVWWNQGHQSTPSFVNPDYLLPPTDRTTVVDMGIVREVDNKVLSVKFIQDLSIGEIKDIALSVSATDVRQLMSGLWEFSFNAGTDIVAKIAEVRALPGVDFVDYADALRPFALTVPPNDYTQSANWLDQIGASSAWNLLGGTTLGKVSVGIIDSGIDKSHEDLTNVISNNGQSYSTHANHVAGILGATTNNGAGRASISYNTPQIYGYTASNTNDLITAIDYMVRTLQVKVINISMGSNYPTQSVQTAIQTFPNTLFVISAGNCGPSAVSPGTQRVYEPATCSTNPVQRDLQCVDIYSYDDKGTTNKCDDTINTIVNAISYPAAYNESNVLAVGAVTESGAQAGFSNSNSYIDIWAPGTNINSTTTSPSSYGIMQGTSMAAPVVSGVASLVLATKPSLTTTELADLLVTSATSVPRTVSATGAIAQALGVTTAPPSSKCVGSKPLLYGVGLASFGAEELAYASDVGSSVMRIGLNWDLYEPNENDYSGESRFDTQINMAHNAGIELIGFIIGTPDWAKAPGDSRPAHRALPDYSKQTAYEEFLGRLVNRYPFISKYEFWNEENGCGSQATGGCSYNDISVSEYAHWLKITYDKIKSVNPAIRIAVGGIDGGSKDTGFMPLLNRVAANPGYIPYDAVAVHPYGDNQPVDMNWMATIHSQSYNKPLWVTEYGWKTSGNGSVTPEIQAQYLRESLDAMASADYIEIAQYLAIKDFDSNGWGLIDSSGTKRPAYCVMKNACSGSNTCDESDPNKGGQVCGQWQETTALPSGVQTHQGVSYAYENHYYVEPPGSGGVYYAEQKSDGSLTDWQHSDIGNYPYGYSVFNINGELYNFWKGELAHHVFDETGKLVSINGRISSTKSFTDRFGESGDEGARPIWETTSVADFGNVKVVYLMSTFDLANYSDDNSLHSKVISSGLSSSNYQFDRLADPGFGAYKTAVYVENSSTGYLYAGTTSGGRKGTSTRIMRTTIHPDGSVSGGWTQVATAPASGQNRGDMFVFDGYLYLVRGTSFVRGKIESGGAVATWEELPELPSDLFASNLGWAGESESPAYGIINGWLYVTGVDRVYYINLSGNCSGNGGTSGGYKPGVGTGISCTIPEWLVNGPGVNLPEIKCEKVLVAIENPDYTPVEGEPPISLPGPTCSMCTKSAPQPQPEWVRTSPLGVDDGQKDGTAKLQNTRSYRYYDYDNGTYIDVPPYWFGTGGGSSGGNTSGNSPSDPGLFDSLYTNVPCGWPVQAGYRKVTWGCSSDGGYANGDTQHEYCPSDRGYGSTAACNGQEHREGGTYTAVDIGGQFSIYTPMDGTLYRCIDTTINRSPSQTPASYGIYTIIQGTPNSNGIFYTLLFGHMLYDPVLDTQTPLRISNPCLYSGGAQNGLVEMRAVHRGDFIGYSDNTGSSTGPHLHYEIRKGNVGNKQYICPASYLDKSNTFCKTGIGSVTTLNQLSTQSFIEKINPFSFGTDMPVVDDQVEMETEHDLQ